MLLESKKKFKVINKNMNEMPVLYENEDIPYWVDKLIDTPVGRVRVIKTELEGRDKIGGYKARWGINRDNYKVSPGLYAIGNPDSSCNVIVSANYKLTLDKLRVELKGQNLWIVIIDTKGINVWCAAGKGTFGTTEIIGRIRKVVLNKVVQHNRIILPQLSAPGVSAHVVTKMTGFRVIYGPIASKDIVSFIENDFVASCDMREVRFDFIDRLVLTPIEIMHSLKFIPIIYLVFLILNFIKPGEINLGASLTHALFNSLPYYIALFLGTFMLPVLLPYIPFKAFSLKGMLLGFIVSAISIGARGFFMYPNSLLICGGNTLILTSVVAFIGLNFTGCTTYTSLSGVQLETKWATIFCGGASLVGMVLLLVNIGFRFV